VAIIEGISDFHHDARIHLSAIGAQISAFRNGTHEVHHYSCFYTRLSCASRIAVQRYASLHHSTCHFRFRSLYMQCSGGCVKYLHHPTSSKMAQGTSSALDLFFSGLLDGVADSALVPDHAKCHESPPQEGAGRETTCPHSPPKANRWDVGGGRVSLGFPLSPPSSSHKRALEKEEKELHTSTGPDGETPIDTIDTMEQNVESSDPQSSPEKRSVTINEEVSLISLGCDIRVDVCESVRLKFPSSPPSSVERRRAAMKKKLLASSRWESENQNLSLYQLISHTPPIRPTRGPNLITDIDIASLQVDLEAIQRMQGPPPCAPSTRTPTSRSVGVPQSLRSLPY
jgi:hypothetical protein